MRLNKTGRSCAERLVSGLGMKNMIFLKDLSTHLRAFSLRRPQLPDEVEDLVQETLLAIHNQRHTYDAGQPLTSWIHAIAKYKFVDFLRRRAGREALNDPLDDTSEVVRIGFGGGRCASEDVLKMLDLLPERQRLPIQHVKIEGLSIVEAGHYRYVGVGHKGRDTPWPQGTRGNSGGSNEN